MSHVAPLVRAAMANAISGPFAGSAPCPVANGIERAARLSGQCGSKDRVAFLVIGAASAFGTVLTGRVALDRLAPQGDGVHALIALFTLTVLFKLAQGSSMATVAAIVPVAAPIVLANGVNEIAAVFAICLDSFIAIRPNGSYRWLVRRDALAGEQSERRAMDIVTGGAGVQAVAGMAILLALVAL